MSVIAQSSLTDIRTPTTLSVIIPALNEEDGIIDIIQRLKSTEASLQAADVNQLEIIVVDDGSQDRTAGLVAESSGVRLIRHPVNRGYGAAIKTGFASAKGELLAFLDADGTYPPENLPALCRAVLDEKADLAVGSRRSGAESDMPAVRRLGNLIWSGLVSLTGNRHVDDPASGMRVLHRSALHKLYPLPNGLNFTPVMTTRAVHEGLRMQEVPIPYRERLGHSKLSVVHDGIRFLSTIIWTALEYNPARVLGLIGLLAMSLVGLILLVFISLRLQGITNLGPWGVFGLYSSLVLAVAGVSIFSLGATFNYLVALFHRRPIVQGMFGKPIFSPALDQHFGWMGMLLAVAGVSLSTWSLILGLRGWEITRLWFWLLGSALLILVGLQLGTSWILMRVLETLSLRDERIGQEIKAVFVNDELIIDDHAIQNLLQYLIDSLNITVAAMITIDRQEDAFLVKAICPIRSLDTQPTEGRRVPANEAPTLRKVSQDMQPMLFRHDTPKLAAPAYELENTLTSGLKSGAMVAVNVNGNPGVISLGEMRAWNRSPFTDEKLQQSLKILANW